MQFSPQWFTKGYKSSTIKIFITFTQTSLIFTKLSKHLFFFFFIYIYTLEKNGLNGRPTQYYQWLHIQLYINKEHDRQQIDKKIFYCKTNSERYIFNLGTKNEIVCSIFGNEVIEKLLLLSLCIFDQQLLFEVVQNIKINYLYEHVKFGACWHCQIVLAVINLSFAKLPLITVYKHVCP